LIAREYVGPLVGSMPKKYLSKRVGVI